MIVFCKILINSTKWIGIIIINKFYKIERISKDMLSIVIPTYNEERDIQACLESLKKQSYKNFEIIVVDDGSSDKTVDVVKKYKIKLIKGEHKGPGFSRNLGAKQARGDILIFIDADMTFDKDYLKNLIKPLKDKKILGTSHDYEVVENTNNKWSALWGRVRIDFRGSNYPNKPYNTAFRAIRKAAFLKLGGFDPKYGYADDQTLFFKYKLMPRIAPNTTCYHKNPETLKASFKQARWIGTAWRERYSIFRFPVIGHLASLGLFVLIPLMVLVKSLKTRSNFIDSTKFFSVKFYGYSIGVFNSVFLRKFAK